MKKPFANPSVAAVFEAYPQNLRARLIFLRGLIFKIAAKTKGVGALEETLKWGEPSYITKSKSGTTLRVAPILSQKGKYGIFVHCQTTLVGPFKEIYGDKFTYDRNRGLIFHENDKIPVKEVSHFIHWALTYHLKKEEEDWAPGSRD